MEDKLMDSISYVLPAIVTGIVAYYILSAFIRQDNNERKFKALVEKKRDSLPMKLQAYERMLLFCERINPTKLLLRVKPIGTNSENYLQLLIANIEQEFEHNFVQQLYVSEASWEAILKAKLAIVTKIKKLEEQSKSASDLRENILIDFNNGDNPSNLTIHFLKQEAKKLF
ncbi:hypothetical protein [Tenacibaculum sp. SG-28]|uniref:DUF7935 family protein n=1 Tax=Tenacibaculum sp. SG-28 TaxID=754426 RepID=UPI000CF3A844|nr:hypothetical protein [Tenacibaculum sp. SG-28]PQJ23296.1 hypothetical protein BSU00_03570 [Tenacibaculum sp. SG-28]